MIALYADGGASIGIGHLMRCLAIAHALKSFGVSPLFITNSPLVERRATEEGFPVFLIAEDRNSFGAGTHALRKILKKFGIDALLVDSYQVARDHLASLEECTRVIYMDDLQEEKFPITAVINGNLSADLPAYNNRYKASKTKALVGTEYCVIRKEFCDVKPIEIKEQVCDVLVSTGGSDPYNASILLAKILLSLPCLNDSRIHILAGALNPNVPDLLRIAKEHSRLKVHEGLKEVSSLMLNCDLAVAAAGTTLNELCVCGVPTITFSLADNQKLGAARFAEKGLAINAGFILDEDFEASILKAVGSIALDYAGRKRIANEAQSVFDGRGAHRVAKYLVEL